MTLSTLSKTFDPGDYAHLGDELARVGHARNMFAGLYNWDHEHRAWEYSICLAAAGDRSALKGKSCLDIGGGYSILPGLLTWSGAHVTEYEVSDHYAQQRQMADRAMSSEWSATPGGSYCFVQGDFSKQDMGRFDLVTCVSVIEHTENDAAFFQALLDAVARGGTLVLTTDFHPSGDRHTTAHNRTYNAEMLLHLAAWADGYGGFYSSIDPDYTYHGDHVFTYTFASLVLRRPA